MIDKLIEKYKSIDKNEYIPPAEILKDLEELEIEINYILPNKLKTDGINHKIINKSAGEIIKELIGTNKKGEIE
jgi:hypothetical protein